MVCSIWKHIAVRKNGDGLANHPEHKVKRACTKWGIGRCLYTAPRIFVYADKCDKMQVGKNGKPQCYDQFVVSKVLIQDCRIKGIRINNATNGKVAFSWKED